MQNRSASHFFFFLGVLLLMEGRAALAYDQQVSSSLSAEGYSIFTPSGERIRRRRIVEDLYLGAWNLLPGSADPYYRGPRLSIELALRLNTDFGITAEESTQSNISGYVAGVTPIQLDAQIAYVHIENALNGALNAKAGRQIRVDTLGFCAFDGLELSFTLPLRLGFDMYFGYEVRGGQILGYDALELDGTDSGGRGDLKADRFVSRKTPASRLTLGTEVTANPIRWIEMGLAYRTTGLSEPLADARAGGRLSIGASPVTVSGQAMWNVLLNGFTDIDAEIAVSPSESIVAYLEYTYYRPSFEGDSIFNVFDYANQNDLGGRVEIEFSSEWKGAIWTYARLTDDGTGINEQGTNEPLSGVGGGLGGRYEAAMRELSIRLSALQEWGESRIGGEFSIGHAALRGERLWLHVRCSAWHIDDIFSERLSGNLFGYVIGARLRLADGAHLLGEFEHYLGGSGSGKFGALAILQLDLWR